MTMPFAVSAGGLISIGLALDVAPGFAIGAEWRPVEFALLSAEVRVALPTAAVYFGSTGAQDIGIYSIVLSPCMRWTYFLGCGSLDLGAQHLPGWATQRGGLMDWAFRFAVGPRLGVDFPFAERFSARIMGDLFFPYGNVRLADETIPGVYTTPIVSGFVTAGLTVAF